jgi:sec-independent protein translocase protein TatA
MLLSILLFLGSEDIILIAVVVLLLFGGKKIPELMKGLGKGVKSFKDGMEGIDNELKNPLKQEPAKEPEKDKPPEKTVNEPSP